MKNKEALVIAYNKGYRVIKGQVISPRGKIRKIRKSNSGDLSFRISAGSNIYGAAVVHRLVAYQKYGDELFREGIEARHLDGNRNNNNEENIVIGTHSQNMMDIPKEIRVNKARHASTKYNAEPIKKDRELGMKYKSLMKKYNIKSKGTISYIINKR